MLLMLILETYIESLVKIRSAVNEILLFLVLFVVVAVLIDVVDPRNLHLKFGQNRVSSS